MSDHENSITSDDDRAKVALDAKNVGELLGRSRSFFGVRVDSAKDGIVALNL